MNSDVKSSSDESTFLTPKLKVYNDYKKYSQKKYKKVENIEIVTDIVKNKFINRIKNKLKSDVEEKFMNYGMKKLSESVKSPLESQ
jgi:hypothetical protein